MGRPVLAGSGRFSGFFFRWRVLGPTGFCKAPPWCCGVIPTEQGVQRRRFGAKPELEKIEAQTTKKEADRRTNLHKKSKNFRRTNTHRRGCSPPNGRMLRNKKTKYFSQKIPSNVHLLETRGPRISVGQASTNPSGIKLSGKL